MTTKTLTHPTHWTQAQAMLDQALRTAGHDPIWQTRQASRDFAVTTCRCATCDIGAQINSAGLVSFDWPSPPPHREV